MIFLHDTALHGTAPHPTTRHSTTRHSFSFTALHRTALHGTSRHITTQHNIRFPAQHVTTPHVTTPHNTTQHPFSGTARLSTPRRNTSRHNATRHPISIAPQHATTRHSTAQRTTPPHNSTQQPLTTMPSIAEIIAARIAAKQASQPVDATERKTVDGIDYARNALNPEWVAQGPSAAPRESMTEKLELDALDTRLAPVKPAVAAAARKATGIVLSINLPPSAPNGESRGQATPIRTLGEPVTPPQPISIKEAWGATLGCTEADLCLMRDPSDTETCWLAVRHQECIHPPILIMRLPWLLWDQPMSDEDIPF